MGSKKVLYTILIVGFIVFVVSLIIGRPWWQATLFSVGFLLIAAIVTSSGLVVPESLFGRRFPRRRSSEKPIENTDKADFLMGMESVLEEVSADSGATTEDARWIEEYTRVMQEIGELVYEVHENVGSRDKVKQLRAFRGVVQHLPSLISEFKSIPEPITPQRQETIERQAQGMDLYLLACSNFTKASETEDGDLAGQAAEQINEALKLLNLMDKPTGTRGWRR